MSLINKEISDFKAYAFHGDDFKMVSKEEILGNGVCSFSILQILPLYVQRSWKI